MELHSSSEALIQHIRGSWQKVQQNLLLHCPCNSSRKFQQEKSEFWALSVTKKGGEKLLASTSPAMIPTPKTVVEIPKEENPRDIPARLRGKYFVPVKREELTKNTTSPEAAKASEENTSLWQRLTNRYQLHYDKFLEKKNP